MDEGRYGGGRFSLRVPPVFCGDGSLIAIAKGRRNALCFYHTLGNGEALYEFSLCSDNANRDDFVTGLVSVGLNQYEFIVASTYNGSLSIYSVEDSFVDSENKEKEVLDSYNIVRKVLNWKTNKRIIDLKNSENWIYILTKDDSGENINDSYCVSLYRIEINKMVECINSRKEEDKGNGNNSVGVLADSNKMFSFAYGASNLTVSKDDSLFCFTWKNILVIWTPEHKEKIIRFRHSEFILSICLSDKNEFIATGDAYGRLTYWFLPFSNTKEWSKMWSEAPLATERSNVEEMIYKYGIKASMSHWHSHELKALSIIPNTNVVVSGGEEAVLVLWRQNDNSGSFSKKSRNGNGKHNNGSRQFIPRLGAPIYTITTHVRGTRRNNENSIFISEKIQDIESNSAKSKGSNRSFSRYKPLLPQLISGIVCSDNSIKIIDLVHNRIINCIYGVSTPFGCINTISQSTASSFEDIKKNPNDTLSCNMKLADTKFLDPSRLLVSVIGNPFRLHVHDIIKDLWVSSLICRPEETYVSGIGEGLSSSKLYKYKKSVTQDAFEYKKELEGNSARIFISNAYFSIKGDLVLTVECQKYSHLNRDKRTYNLKFWRIEHLLGTENSFKFSIVSKYQAAHIDEVISVQETVFSRQIDNSGESEDNKDGSGTEIQEVCFFTITSNCEIKCWTYKKQIDEWINSSIIRGSDDRIAHSACFNRFFDKLFVSTSNGILIYNWSRQNCILFENSYIQCKINGDVKENNIHGDFQILTLNVVDEDSHFVLGFSPAHSRLSLWDINDLSLVTELDIKQELNEGNSYRNSATYNCYSLRGIQNSEKIQLYAKKRASFEFVITSRRGSVLLFTLFNDKQGKKRSDKKTLFKIKFVRKIEIGIQNEISVVDSVVQFTLSGSKVLFYIVILFSSCEIYSQVIETLERLDGKTCVEAKKSDDSMLNIKESISRMYISSSKTGTCRNEVGPGHRINDATDSLSAVSDAVKDIIKGKFEGNVLTTKPSFDSQNSSFSVLFSIQEATRDGNCDGKYRNVERLSENLNTFMCPSAPNLLWNIMTNSFSGSNNSNYAGSLPNKEAADLRISLYSEKSNSSSLDLDIDKKDHRRIEEDALLDEQVIYGLSLRPIQTQKLQSILKRSTIVS
ncbi:WD40 repeat protein [Cryptosporidium ryanae]|uniref:WD40 repeat protein n=1 Tax=Cryptosporidium ryanae TaxID=515981 RepID=UPI00351A3A01|nr:WD40 repeat protein [Cryptosporidium ryanae]